MKKICLSNTTPVLCAIKGSNTDEYEIKWVPFGEIKHGDKVISWDGSFKDVVLDESHGEEEFYRVTLRDGRSIEVSEGSLIPHILHSQLGGHHPRVRDANGRITNKREVIPLERYEPSAWKLATAKEMIGDYLGREKVSKEGYRRVEHKYYLPPSHPVELPEQKLPIDPYVMGIILGDGSITKEGQVRITGMDPELISTVTHMKALFRPERSTKGVNNYDGSTARFANELKQLGLAGTYSYNKFIPEQYLIGSIEQRYAFLRGLLDTDGTISHGESNIENNQVEFSTTSKEMAMQVQSIVYSLGGTASIHSRLGKYKKPNGDTVYTRENYRLFIRSLECPFRLLRKAQYWNPQKRLGYVSIYNIEHIGKQSAKYIAIDGAEQSCLASRLFVIE